MSKSSIPRSAIKLGELLVKELEVDPGGDYLTRWMAHHIAEKLTLAKECKGIQKSAIEKECYDLILELWKHRFYFPNGHKPLANYDLILETLERINPDRPVLFYDSLFPNSENNTTSKNENLLDLAKQLDRTSRSIISDILEYTTKSSTTEEDLEYLDSSVDNLADTSTQTISQLIDMSENRNSDRVKSRIDALDGFLKTVSSYKDLLDQELHQTLEDEKTKKAPDLIKIKGFQKW